MKVLVVGGGGREHAICWKLAQSPKVTKLYCAPGNGGIAQVAQCVPIKATDVDGMVKWARENAMDFVMVAPDDPLALGCVDRLHAVEHAGVDQQGNEHQGEEHPETDGVLPGYLQVALVLVVDGAFASDHSVNSSIEKAAGEVCGGLRRR